MQTQLLSRKASILTAMKHNITCSVGMRKEFNKQFFSTHLSCNRNKNKLEERKKLITENFKGCTQLRQQHY